MYAPSRAIVHLLTFLSVLFLPFQRRAEVPQPPMQVAKEAASALLQFTSSGHILGFASDGVYAATGSHALHVDFIGANAIQPKVDSTANAGDGQAAPLTRVEYADLWEGITLAYTTDGGGIYTTTYTLAPGADVNDIQLKYNTPLTLDADGSLGIAFDTGALTETAPIAWQEIDGQRISVDVAFQVEGQTVSFMLGKYDLHYPLTIDPTLTWNTFLGGSGNDFGNAIALDANGNVYVVGSSNATWGSPVRAYLSLPSFSDAFAAKLNSAGALVWNTFLGGSESDVGNAIAVDGSGNVYVAGYSGTAWGCSPTACTVRAHTSIIDANIDAFAAKLNSAGILVWNTFLGGTVDDIGNAIAVDGSGNVYVAGSSTATWGSPVRAYTSDNDAFAAKLNSAGALLWNTFLGGSGFDVGSAIAVDGSGNVYVAGSSPATWGSPVRAYTSGYDAFAAKLNSAGVLVWNTFLGGNGGTDWGSAIAVDGNGNVYVAGTSTASWGCSPTACTVRAYTSGYDAFAAKLNSAGALVWNTFLGGNGGTDWGSAIAVDGNGNVYVAGVSTATWGSPVRAYSASDDGFAAKLNSAGALVWNTFLGGSGVDQGYAIAVDGSGNMYVAGISTATWGSPVRAYTSGADAFVVRMPILQTPGPAVYHVKPAASGTRDCSSWSNACTLQTALNNAISGDQVWVAAGTYKPHASDRTKSFRLVNGVAIYGGFNGTETLLSQRNPALNLTVLSGDLSGNDKGYVYDWEPTRSENSYHVVIGSGVQNTAVLDGFTITGGNANAMVTNFSGGGGMLIASGSPTLNNVIFTRNTAFDKGGAMRNNAGSPALTNVIFYVNSAGGDGGGIYNDLSSPTITNATFTSNLSGANGGGMANVNGSNPLLINVTLSANLTSNPTSNGIGMYNDSSSPTLKNVIIANNPGGQDCVSINGALNAASSNNLIEDAANACGLTNGVNGNIIGVDPKLGPLANNGGSTQTFALLAGSPAIDAGNDAACPATDQRGVPRPQESHCDIGAFELVFPVDVYIGGTLRGSYDVYLGQSMRQNYVGVDAGPVKVVHTNGQPIIAALRDAWAVSGVTTSFSQLMGLPLEQLSNKYVFPGYNNITLNDQLRIANVDTSPSTVTVTIGGVLRGTYPLAAGAAVRINYAGLDSGPVVVEGTPSTVKIIAAIREAWSVNGVIKSFVQLMGLPAGQLSNKYVFPAYNNVTLNEQLRIGNVDPTLPTVVTVTIGGTVRGTYPLAAGQAVRVNYAGLDSGPVVVEGSPSTVPIISSIRSAWSVNGVITSFAQLMGMPAEQLSNKYLFPAYNNVTVNDQLRIANVDTNPTTVTVKIGGVSRGTYPLAAGAAVRINYAGLDSGPVVVEGTPSTVKIISAIREAWSVSGAIQSFVQLMGLPSGQLSTTYLFPAYNNVTLNEQLRFGVP